MGRIVTVDVGDDALFALERDDGILPCRRRSAALPCDQRGDMRPLRGPGGLCCAGAAALDSLRDG